MKKDEMETQIHALEDELDDARKEIAWLRQSIYGSEKVAKLEAEIEEWKKALEAASKATDEIRQLKAARSDLETEIELLKSRLLKAVDKIADYDEQQAGESL